MNVDVNQHAQRATREMHRQNSEAASQGTAEVVAWLRAWAKYLEERS